MLCIYVYIATISSTFFFFFSFLFNYAIHYWTREFCNKLHLKTNIALITSRLMRYWFFVQFNAEFMGWVMTFPIAFYLQTPNNCGSKCRISLSTQYYRIHQDKPRFRSRIKQELVMMTCLCTLKTWNLNNYDNHGN